mmetsp:Transcript_60718/g.130418  ORF Transcript_60718/g.130418 Transcript_60718/m.130418 type:complete len:306 (-) Transcript_60718:52-969(-)
MRFHAAALVALAASLAAGAQTGSEQQPLQLVNGSNSGEGLLHIERSVSNATHKPPLAQQAATGAAGTSAAAEPRARRLDAALESAEEQVQAKARELGVQRGLIREEENVAMQAQERAAALVTSAAQLRREADAAMAVARERSRAADRAETDRKDAAARVVELRAEEGEARKFFEETSAEERALELRAASLRAERARMSGGAADTHVAAMVVAVAPRNASAPSAMAATRSHNASVPSTQASSTSEVSLREAMRKLADENDRLKREKDSLMKQLAADRAAQEKEKLRTKLKNRLVQKDRRVLKAKTL